MSIDITFEFALNEDPSIYEYVTFGEYGAKTIRKVTSETGYYGEVYKHLHSLNIAKEMEG